MKCIGEDVSERLVIITEQIYMEEEIRLQALRRDRRRKATYSENAENAGKYPS
jgi:hypothetical protein